MRATALLIGMLLAILASGCTAPAQPEAPTIMRVTASTPESYNQLFDSVATGLRHYTFRLDRRDRVAGIITTFPETSANWFEFWRPQPKPAYYWAEANTKTVQRQAIVQLRPVSGETGAYDLDIEVRRFAYSLEERQVDNSAAAMRIFSGAAPTASGRMESPAESSHWIPLGRDEFMENDILNRIAASYAGEMVISTQPASSE